ncbi:cytochrome-c peroxidase [Oceanospirillum maris]|uniref:cytochrome-c peroxidase n=1 Tax=Oceanospirillum maris TaxID=64977 RepID=UPI00041C07BB|nr:cytochrome c peroxidase [Oceanospirillum maris]
MIPLSQHLLKLVQNPLKLSRLTLVLTCSALCACGQDSSTQTSTDTEQTSGISAKATLGQILFFDPNLSLTRNQSCSSCHDPGRAFTDSRIAAIEKGVSIGDDGISLGNRNAPTLSYIGLTPEFGVDADGEYLGGFFHDGRAKTLQQQAGQPFLNPVEMAIPDKATLIARIIEQPRYAKAFQQAFQRYDFSDTEAVFSEVTESLAAFQQTEPFQPFDAKYDRWLAGEAELTAAEERGRVLFFTSRQSSCINCHRMGKANNAQYETFTHYRYRNIGAPINLELEQSTSEADLGIAALPDLEYATAGAFKTSTLRNIAVTGPYLHNGALKTLEAVLELYNFRSWGNTSNLNHGINPETGLVWQTDIYANQLHGAELAMPELSSQDKQDLIAFLKTLTDRRYEHLLNR